MFSVEDSQTNIRKSVNKSYEFTWINGLCAHGISAKDLFYFQIQNLEIEFPLKIVVADKSRSPYYMLDTNTLSGEPLDLAGGKHKYYSISFEEVSWLEESGECMNYGDNAPYMSYADCVAQEHADTFLPILGCRPPWLSAPGHPENCQGKILWANVQSKEWRRSIKEFELNYLISGKAHTENCLKPCKGLLAYSKLIRSEDSRTDIAKTILSFPREVKVTMHERTYGLPELVVDVGSSLGLWIGLSIVGVFDIVLNTGIFIKKRSCERKKDTKQETIIKK